MGTVKTERMQYSGTPANLNYPDVTTKEDVIWKEVEIPYHEYLEKTMTLFSQHKFKQALQRFETILTTYPTDMNANFYSALCLYNLGQYPKSLERLMKSYSVEFGNFYEEALWYIAQTHEKMRNTHQAKEMYARIEREGGFYAIEAGKKK